MPLELYMIMSSKLLVSSIRFGKSGAKVLNAVPNNSIQIMQ